MSKPKIVELANPLDFRIQGNLSRTLTNQVRRKLGKVHVVRTYDNGDMTVRSGGVEYDCFLNDQGDAVIVPAK